MSIRAAIHVVCMICLIVAPVARAQSTQSTRPAVDAPSPLDANQIARTELARRSENSIRRGVKFLLSRQNSDGSWTDGQADDKDAAGRTALVTLALLYCGESHQSPPLDRAIKFLKKSSPQNSVNATYSVALRAAVYATLPEVLRKTELRADLLWLEQHMIKNGANKGMYDYGRGDEFGGDFSNSQYGVLGVWYAAQAGLEVPRSYWMNIEEAWRKGQSADGGWPYQKGRGNSYGSMTAAGAATLYITNDYLHADEAQDLTNVYVNRQLEDAMTWLGVNFSVNKNPGLDTNLGPQQRPDRDMLDVIGELGRRSGVYIHYMLFGYERVGEASGLTRFGQLKWFDEGADYLVRTQAYDGSWNGTNGTEVDTSYSLLFLSRGRAPVVMQKLQFPGRWNNRPRDAAAFTSFMRRASERHVNWQVVSIDAAPDEFRQAPMLYLASDRPLVFTSPQKARLKAYIAQGGLIVGVNEGKGDDFSKSLEGLGNELFPSYSFRDLPRDHLAYTANFAVSSDEKLRGMSNGIRELIVLYPGGDMTWKWQSTGGGISPRNTPYGSLANLWLYMTDRANPHFKGEDTWVERNEGVEATKKASITRITYDGNWNPEPGGWERLSNVMHNYDQCDLTLTASTEPASDATLAHLTGTAGIRIDSQRRPALKQYLDSGGLLLADAAGSSTETAGTIESLIRELYPTVTIAPLPLDHLIYHATGFGGMEIDNDVNYRRAAGLQNVHIPRLRGAKVQGKLVAILSSEDLSSALVGYNIAGLSGYAPASATDLVRNIILWRVGTSPKP
jgi:hypothetical protein